MHQVFRVLGCISLVSRGDGWKMLKSCVLQQGRAMSYETFSYTFTIQNSAWINPPVTWDPVGIYIYIPTNPLDALAKKGTFIYLYIHTYFFGTYGICNMYIFCMYHHTGYLPKIILVWSTNQPIKTGPSKSPEGHGSSMAFRSNHPLWYLYRRGISGKTWCNKGFNWGCTGCTGIVEERMVDHFNWGCRMGDDSRGFTIEDLKPETILMQKALNKSNLIKDALHPYDCFFPSRGTKKNLDTEEVQVCQNVYF